ncbi:MAG TPA: hypothetical protein VMZ91_07590 [Candidatus Paceibacterota bacterium]|nr:hypothetical protein [Candidatus Paceibacterota bacterium]
MLRRMKLKNKTYQPLQLMINGSTHLVSARNDIIVLEITSQMKKLEKKGFITIRLVR